MTSLEYDVRKTIVDTNGMYEICSTGRIYSCHSNKFLKLIPDKYGYLKTNIYTSSGKCINVRPHQLVARYFIPNPYGYTTINHKDLDKSNNCIENLEWCSIQENLKHARDNLPKWGPRKQSVKIYNVIYNSITEAAYLLGMNREKLKYRVNSPTFSDYMKGERH